MSRRCRWKSSATSANGAAARRAIRRSSTRPASKRRPARWARVAATASAWRSPAAGSPPATTSPASSCSTYNVWVQCSDGDLMEGVANEAASLAGHLKLDNLCWIYDDNHITIEGRTDLAFSEDVATRFRGLGWHVLAVDDANDLAAIDAAYRKVPQARGQPDADRREKHHRLRRPEQGRHGQGARRAARCRRKSRRRRRPTAGRPTRKFLVPPEVPKHFQETLGKRGRKARAGLGEAVRRIRERNIPSWPPN